MDKQCYAVMKRLIEESMAQGKTCGQKTNRTALEPLTTFEVEFIRERFNMFVCDMSLKLGFPSWAIRDRISKML
jgi:hypothetical protein